MFPAFLDRHANPPPPCERLRTFSLVHGIFSGGFASLHWLRNPAHRILRRDNARGFRALRKEQLWQFGSFSVSGDTSAEFTATTERTVPAERVPDIARKFVGNGVAMTQVDTVSAPAADGSRTVSTEVKVNGVPVSAQATQKLTPEGEQTRLDVNGEVSCSIPLVGKKIAAAAEPQVGRVLKVLGSSAEKWLAQR